MGFGSHGTGQGCGRGRCVKPGKHACGGPLREVS